MKYEINGFEDVFKNKNSIHLKKVARSQREANLESWIYGINSAYHYYMIGAFASVYTGQQVYYEGSSILQIYTYCSVSLHFFLSSFSFYTDAPERLFILVGVQHKQQCVCVCGGGGGGGRQQNIIQLASYIFLYRYQLVSKNISLFLGQEQGLVGTKFSKKYLSK